MKKNRIIKIVFFVLILLFTIAAGISAWKDSVHIVGLDKAFEIENTDNVGKIGTGTVIEQTFVAEEDFYGVSLLVGTFGETQHGSMEIKLTDVTTNEVLFEKTIDVSDLKDNRYFYAASEEKILVTEPKTYKVTLTGKLLLPDMGATVWSSLEDQYFDGYLTVNGEEQAGDLVFGLVTAYKESFGMGIFMRRIMIILLISAFLSLHCFLDINKMYQQIFAKRVLIALLLFVFCVANKFNNSSIGMYDETVQTGEGSQYVNPVFGTPRSIRSDEWLVSVPRSISAEYVDYGKMNDIVRGTEVTNLSASGLYRSYSALAKPADWGYYLFGSEYGLSFVWSFRMIFGFLFSFELCFILTKRKKLLSLMGGTLIWFSSYNMWWSTVTWLIAGQAALVFFYYFIREKNIPKKLFFGIGIAISAANYVVDFYPAWQVPSGYVYFALLIYIFVSNREYWKAYKAKDWVMAGGCVVFMISMIVAYLYNYLDYMNAIMNTVYPGSRVIYGGFAIDKLAEYIPTLLTPFFTYENPSEMGCFYGLFPMSVILFIIVLVRKKGKSLLMWLLAVPAIIMSAYCLFPLPEMIAKLTLLTFSMPKRVVDVLGYLNILMLIVALSELNTSKKEVINEKVIGLKVKGNSAAGFFTMKTSILISAVSTAIAIACAFEYCIPRLRLLLIAVAAGVTIVIGTVFLARIKTCYKQAAMIVLTLMVFVSGISVNPLMVGLDAITSKPVAAEIQKITAEDSDAKWIAVDSIIFGDYLIANGASTYNSTNYVPNMEFWEKLDPDGTQDEVYNRYAHITIGLTEDATSMELISEDYIQLNLFYEDLEKISVDYILSPLEIENAEKYGLTQIYGEAGAYIYQYESAESIELS